MIDLKQKWAYRQDPTVQVGVTRGHAQVEAQAYAKAIESLLRDVLPNCMELYDKYRRRPS